MSLLVSIGVVAFGLQTKASAAQTAVLKYQDLRVSIPITSLSNLSEASQTSEDLSAFIEQIPLSVADIDRLLADQIPHNTGIPFSDDLVLFMALQLNKSIGDPLGRERPADIAQSLVKSFQNDQSITMLELAENYPEAEVGVDLNSLQRLHSDLSVFIEKVQPILSAVNYLLPELVCNCDVASLLTPVPVLLLQQDDVVEQPRSDLVLTAATQTDFSHCVSPEQRAAAAAKYAHLREGLDQDLNRLVAANPVIDHSMTTPVRSQFISAELMKANLDYAEARSQLVQPVSAQSDSWTPVDQHSIAQNFTPIAESVVFVFGPVRPSFKIADLQEFARTGRVPRGWRFYFNVANVDSKQFHKALVEDVEIDSVQLSNVLNSFIGEYVLFQASRVVHTPVQTANIQALRSAIVLSAADDNKISLLEVLTHYPASNVIVEGLNLARFTGNLKHDGIVSTTTAGLENMLLQMQANAADHICECEE